MILIIDDDPTVRMSLKLLLRRAGFSSEEASSPDEALSKARLESYSLILMDMNYSLSTTGEEGLELLMKMRIFQPDTPIILITAWGSIELAVEGMRAGAYDFITKPWDNRTLLQRIETALSLNAENNPIHEKRASAFDRGGIIGSDPALIELLSTVERVAPTDASVLILGENGTGKEMIAQAIHANSRRSKNPFVMVNLGGIAQSLFESEMFGHAKGAFTGAIAARKGRFEMADKGTIFLDEIGDLDMSCQVKLLRVLQQHTFEPLGDSRSRKVDIRVVSATNADLPAMVEARTFREDLFYRLNLITLRMPPLRERASDIPELLNHFLSSSASAENREIPEIEAETMEWLMRLPYPGNIRQLKNMAERALLVGGKILTKKDFFTPGLSPENAFVAPASTLESREKRSIKEALDAAGGNMSRAARALGITRQALYRRIEKYGLNE
ncbi:MAG: sigma-54-dependent Fis family transcriptional regulator [Bacteroides sp.]|nr:sigma-54-dependent Fis family transcriptional regulator [Bacteroides sp.]